MGDFNLPVPWWGNTFLSHFGYDLYNNILEIELHQHVNSPTRDNNILDLVQTTCEYLVTDPKVGLEFSTSDHHLITFKVKMKNKGAITRTFSGVFYWHLATGTGGKERSSYHTDNR